MKKTFIAPKVSDIELQGNIILANSPESMSLDNGGPDVSNPENVFSAKRGIFD